MSAPSEGDPSELQHAPMSGQLYPAPTDDLEAHPDPTPRRLVGGIAITAAGALEFGLVYLALEPRLPATIPASLITAGFHLSPATPGFLAQFTLGAIGILGLLFIGLTAFIGDDDALEAQLGRFTVNPLALVFGSLILVSLPTSGDLVLLASAGVVPADRATAVLVPILGALPVVVAVAIVVLARWRTYRDELRSV
ncbi:MAG TPA: hypothetical protein VGV89_02735 [Thermoplasmata archaeon]|nr:hypothetical protein [Thermoplasmata archaeon]